MFEKLLHGNTSPRSDLCLHLGLLINAVCCDAAHTWSQIHHFYLTMDCSVVGLTDLSHLPLLSNIFILSRRMTFILRLVLQPNSHTCITLAPYLNEFNAYGRRQLVVLLYLSSVLSIVGNRKLDFHLHIWLSRMQSTFPRLLDMAI